jgi:hypothetical protein
MTIPPRRAWLLGLFFFMSACGDSGGGAQAGQETAACVDGMCFAGLECLSNLCVAGDTTAGTATPTTGQAEGDVAPGLPCNPYLQDCIAGFKCHPQDDETDVCVKIDDEAVDLGEVCRRTQTGGNNSDTCREGAFCDEISTAEPVCIPMCSPPVEKPTCDSPDTICHAYKGGTAPVCRQRCDPLEVTCAYNGLCIPSLLENGFFCFSAYNKFDYGEVCYGGINSCIKGQICAPDEGFPPGGCIGGDYGCCTYVCNLTAPACPGQVPNCVPWWPVDSAPPGDEHIGYCAI